MPEDASEPTCEEFQNQIGDLMSSGEDLYDHPHVKACAYCRELVRELEIIAEAARRRFGNGEPHTDDWSEST